MTTFYVDTSVAGRAMLRFSPRAVSWFEEAAESDELVSSRLLKTELTRSTSPPLCDLASRTS
ncbi:hypothetical protein [Agrococcus lahaulensis]|uniref:hypothetical protein n=1 Tax=Agrococcus lahaulensis TaxID=341722 RepID=UPI00047A11F0|nr:hypothetical protein [Agrococcus lahaulensis]